MDTKQKLERKEEACHSKSLTIQNKIRYIQTVPSSKNSHHPKNKKTIPHLQFITEGPFRFETRKKNHSFFWFKIFGCCDFAFLILQMNEKDTLENLRISLNLSKRTTKGLFSMTKHIFPWDRLILGFFYFSFFGAKRITHYFTRMTLRTFIISNLLCFFYYERLWVIGWGLLIVIPGVGFLILFMQIWDLSGFFMCPKRFTLHVDWMCQWIPYRINLKQFFDQVLCK